MYETLLTKEDSIIFLLGGTSYDEGIGYIFKVLGVLK